MIRLDLVEKIGLLGMNRRNAEYTLARNPRRHYPLVDNKLITKEILERHGLPAPELYFKIRGNFELKRLRAIEGHHDFVIKPARGAEGRGIVVITDRTERGWVKSSGEVLSKEDLEYHVSNILAGLYSLGGVDDQAFVEYRVTSHRAFDALAYRGVPDVRMILYRGVPVMSMLRLPTKESDGRANLHQGAVGVGIDLRAGRTLGGVHRDRLITRHPDTGAPVAGLSIPFWDGMLETAVRVSEVFHLGYIGVDFVVDHLLGPLILELNARPGLSIQLANRRGLLPRLRAVDSLGAGVEALPWKERLEICRRIGH